MTPHHHLLLGSLYKNTYCRTLHIINATYSCGHIRVEINFFLLKHIKSQLNHIGGSPLLYPDSVGHDSITSLCEKQTSQSD